MKAGPGAGQTSVLVIEDDPTIGRALEVGLASNGYATTWCRTGGSGLVESRRVHPDAVLLDLGLPDVDGIEVARTLRIQSPGVLLIILTARSEEIDVIAGLDAGADDYLVKPFSLTVLLARIRAHLRRRPAEAAEPARPLRVADLTIDAASRRCLVADTELSLRPKEFELLLVLVQSVGTAVTREELMARVWDENWFGSTKTLDVTMAALRRRLLEAATAPTRPRLPDVTTLRGHGYRLDPPGGG